MTTNKTNNCLSEVSLSLTQEESRENSCSFTSRKIMRSFRQKPDTVQRTIRQLLDQEDHKFWIPKEIK